MMIAPSYGQDDFDALRGALGHMRLLPDNIVTASLAERAAFGRFTNCDEEHILEHQAQWMIALVQLAALVDAHVKGGA